MTHCLIVFYNCIKFHLNSFNVFQLTMRTRNSIANNQREITPKISKAELWFLCLTHRLNVFYNRMKLQLNSFNSVQLIEWTRNCIYLCSKGNDLKPEDQWSCKTLTWYLNQEQNKIWFKMAQSFLRKASFNFQMLMTLGQGQEMTLTFNTQISSLSRLVSGHKYVTEIWPCRKIGQGQPRVIIWTNYDGQESSMLHTKFCGNQSTSSGEEDFWRVFTIYGHGGHLGNVTTIVSIYFHFLVPESLHIKFGFDWPSGFWEEPVLIFKCKWRWAKVKKWPWPSILTYLHYLNWFQVSGCKISEKSTVFTFSYR